MLKYLLLTLTLTNILSQISSTSSLADFLVKYNCKLTDQTLKCSNINSKIIDFDLLDIKIRHLDLSNNRITTLKFSNKTFDFESLNLSNNSITSLDENYFAHLPHLKTLDLSFNPLEEVDKTAFDGLNVIETLNLTRTNKKYSIELCSLTSLKKLVLNNLDLSDIFLECWKTTRLTDLIIKNTVNSHISWKNWYPYLSELKHLDLSNSSTIYFESFQNRSLTHLILSDNPQLNKTDFINLLKTTCLLTTLKCLVLKNSGLDSNNFPFAEIVSTFNSSLGLEMLDLAGNSYSDDLNEFLFDQKNLINLKYFNGHGNKFKQCNKRLTQNYLENLEYLDLSNNQLEKSSCLYSLRQLKSLTYLDMSSNLLSITETDLNLANVFYDIRNLSWINLSKNLFEKFSIQLSLNHTEIKLLDLSFNKLLKFRFEPVNSTNEDDVSMYDYEDGQGEVIIQNTPSDDNDERYIDIVNINLSHNDFNVINLNHQFQTVENVIYLNFSHNPIHQVIGLSGDPVLVSNPKEDVDELKKILCIDALDFGHNKLNRIPNLQHSCINKLNLNNNLIDSAQHLILSNFSLNFIDLISLRGNNIEKLGIIVSGQKFKSDFYKHQNSPKDFFYGKVNNTQSNHTIIDVKDNANFKCDCKLFELIHDYPDLKVRVDCGLTSDMIKNCTRINENTTTKKYSIDTKVLNSRLKFVFIMTCLVLIIVSISLIYYMGSDLFKNFAYFDQIRNVAKRKYDQFVKNRPSENVGVQYSKLKEDATASTIEINS